MKKPQYAGNSDFYRKVGAKIARVRRGKLTQKELAEKVAMTRTSIVNIEKGRQQIFLHTIVDIANALSVSPADLLLDQSSEEVIFRGTSQKGRDWVNKYANKTK